MTALTDVRAPDPAGENRSGRRPEAIIRSVEVIPLRLPFGRPFKMAAPHEPARGQVETVIVRITSDRGDVGIGETQAWRRQGSAETLTGLVSAIRQHVEPALVQQPVLNIAASMAAIEARLSGNLYVQAAVGDALYDLAARTLGCSVGDLVGGCARKAIAVGLALSSEDPEAMVDATHRALERGYRHIRVKIGIDPVRDLASIAAVRKTFGDRIVLRADANGGMSYGDALRLLVKLEAFDLDIVEQPVPGWDLDGMAALSRAVRIPLSADESLSTQHSLLEIGRRQAARVIQTKTGKNGGIHHIRNLWTLADSLGIGIFPGNHPSTGVNVAAVAHLASAWPKPLLVGDFQTGCVDMIREDILAEPLQIRDGQVLVPEGPGFGVSLDEDKLRHYRADI